jgi:hypothetical protein
MSQLRLSSSGLPRARLSPGLAAAAAVAEGRTGGAERGSNSGAEPSLDSDSGGGLAPRRGDGLECVASVARRFGVTPGSAPRSSPGPPTLNSSSPYSHAKDDLSRWWLEVVELSVENWLMSAYNSRYTRHDDCVPEQYLDVPPKDLNLVKRNHAVICEVLSERGSGANVFIHLLRPLADLVYGRIAELERVLRLLLELYGREMDPKTRDHHESDLEYLRQMRILEGEFEAKFFGDDPRRRKGDVDDFDEGRSAVTGKSSGAPSVSSIVPVSGLAWGKLHRLDNELKTVIGHWDRARR